MTSFEDVIWQDLVANHNAGHVDMPRATRASTRRYGSPRFAVGAGGVAVAAGVAAVLVLTGTSATPPAYALTANGNGSYTLTINDLQVAIPEVNAELAKLGVRAKAIPVTSTCSAPDTAGIHLEGFGKASMSVSMTVDNANIPSGWTGYLAAEQLPDGRVALALGASPVAATALPACLNSNQPVSTVVPPNPTSTGTSTSPTSASITTTGASTTGS